MRTTVNGLRFMLFVGAAIFGAIALAIAALVIPPALADTFPRASPIVAAIALAVNAGLNLLVALRVFSIARRLSESGPSKGGNLPVFGLLAIVLDLLLLDAADDFSAHGPAMAPAVTWLFVVSVSGVLSGILLIVSAALLSKQDSKAIEQPLR